MKVVRRTMWPGHTAIFFIVGRWRRPYRWFNRLFAVGHRRVELVIIDHDTFYRYRSFKGVPV